MKLESALSKFRRFNGFDETNPVEQLRFFCSNAMSGDDWLDLEQFIDAVIKDKEDAIRAERESCAKVCEQFDDGGGAGESWAFRFAEKVRERSNKE